MGEKNSLDLTDFSIWEISANHDGIIVDLGFVPDDLSRGALHDFLGTISISPKITMFLSILARRFLGGYSPPLQRLTTGYSFTDNDLSPSPVEDSLNNSETL